MKIIKTIVSAGFLVFMAANAQAADHGYRRTQHSAGHYENRCRRVWVAGQCARYWVAPVWGQNCYGPYIIRNGYWTTRQSRGYYKIITERVWVAGH